MEMVSGRRNKEVVPDRRDRIDHRQNCACPGFGVHFESNTVGPHPRVDGGDIDGGFAIRDDSPAGCPAVGSLSGSRSARDGTRFKIQGRFQDQLGVSHIAVKFDVDFELGYPRIEGDAVREGDGGTIGSFCSNATGTGTARFGCDRHICGLQYLTV